MKKLRLAKSASPRRRSHISPNIKVLVEKHRDGYIAYPLGLRGVVVGQGDSYEEALADVRSAIQFHIATFGRAAFGSESPVLEAFIAETRIAG